MVGPLPVLCAAQRCAGPLCALVLGALPAAPPSPWRCCHAWLLQGLCSATDCPYLHVNLSPEAPLCKAFLRGYCPAGARCPHKHYTLRMVKEERRVEQAPKARRAQREQRQPGMQGGVATGRKLREETEVWVGGGGGVCGDCV